MTFTPYIEATLHALGLVSLVVFMFVRIHRPITPASATKTDHGYWVLPVGLIVAISLLRLLYLIDSEQILGYPA